MTVSPEWVSIVAPFASGAFGVGLGYGLIKAQIAALKERVERNERIIEKQVGESRCKEYRDTCREEWKEDIERIERKQNGVGGNSSQRKG